MLTELMIAAMTGVSQALAERFVRGRETSTSLRSVLKDVQAIKEIQARDRAALVELKHLLAHVLEHTDGLEVRHRKVVFAPTDRTPNVESALLNLDLEISRLRLGDADSAIVPHDPSDRPDAPDRRRPDSRDPATISRSSIFYQLDEEIAALRRGTGNDR